MVTIGQFSLIPKVVDAEERPGQLFINSIFFGGVFLNFLGPSNHLSFNTMTIDAADHTRLVAARRGQWPRGKHAPQWDQVPAVWGSGVGPSFPIRVAWRSGPDAERRTCEERGGGPLWHASCGIRAVVAVGSKSVVLCLAKKIPSRWTVLYLVQGNHTR